MALRDALVHAQAAQQGKRPAETEAKAARHGAAPGPLPSGFAPPSVALVLGSGLGAFANLLEEPCAVPFAAVPAMPVAQVAGHRGAFVMGTFEGLRICGMQGRVHLYEGHTPSAVVRGVRAMIALGAHTVILTNAAGGIRQDLEPGSLMVIRDHLNLTAQSPLAGPNDDALGPRFPALNDAYDPELRVRACEVGRASGFEVPGGVYAGVLGPAYETPAEVRMLRALGADAVGMSTVLETIAARHMGARVLGISCITNRAAGLVDEAPSHAEVQAIARIAEERFSALLSGILRSLAQEQPARAPEQINRVKRPRKKSL